jgi:hypothetical protein
MAAITPRNRMLAALSPKDLALLTPSLRQVSLPLRYELERPGILLFGTSLTGMAIRRFLCRLSSVAHMETLVCARPGFPACSSG